MTVEVIHWLGLGTIAISYCAIGMALLAVAWASIELKRNIKEIRLQKIVAAVLRLSQSTEEVGNRDSGRYQLFGKRIRLAAFLLLIPIILAFILIVAQATLPSSSPDQFMRETNQSELIHEIYA